MACKLSLLVLAGLLCLAFVSSGPAARGHGRREEVKPLFEGHGRREEVKPLFEGHRRHGHRDEKTDSQKEKEHNRHHGPNQSQCAGEFDFEYYKMMENYGKYWQTLCKWIQTPSQLTGDIFPVLLPYPGHNGRSTSRRHKAARVAGPAVEGNCGMLGDGISIRVLGGSQATLGQFPWQARLSIALGGGYYGQCGGTIISDEWVVSAAHCIENEDGSRITDVNKLDLYFGEINSEDSEATEFTTKPSKIIVHPERKTPTSAYIQTSHDLIMVKLAKKLTFNKYINAACLPNSNEEFAANTECIVSGFGATGLPSGAASPVLKYAAVDMIARSTCKELIGSSFDESYLCAGRSTPQLVDACQGDSGGPLVCKSNGRYTLEGAVAFGDECAKLKESNGVYSSIPNALDWIKKTMAGNPEGNDGNYNYYSYY